MKNIKWQYFIMGMLTMALVLIAIPNILAYFGIHLQFSKTTVGDKVDILERYIDKYFWKDMDQSELESYALKGLVYGLDDKYSTYYTDVEYQKVTEQLDGVYKGIGVVVKQDSEKKLVVVQEVYEESPAEKAGIKVGDIFVKVDGKNINTWSFEELAQKLKGETGTKVTIVVNRNGMEVNCEAVREELKVKTVKYKKLESGIGYVSISEFDHETITQFKEAMQVMNQGDVKGVIFDIRDNGGGTMSTVTEMLDELLPEGMILSVKNKEETLEEYKSTNTQHYDKPCVVLINENSASAAEVFAGALQDRGAASLVGTKSYGKGIVQTIFSLEGMLGGGAIKLTTAEYFLPSGRSIHEEGLTPDVTTKMKEGDGDRQLRAALKEIQRKIENNTG